MLSRTRPLRSRRGSAPQDNAQQVKSCDRNRGERHEKSLHSPTPSQTPGISHSSREESSQFPHRAICPRAQIG